jgi:hypothetical protein
VVRQLFLAGAVNGQHSLEARVLKLRSHFSLSLFCSEFCEETEAEHALECIPLGILHPQSGFAIRRKSPKFRLPADGKAELRMRHKTSQLSAARARPSEHRR